MMRLVRALSALTYVALWAAGLCEAWAISILTGTALVGVAQLVLIACLLAELLDAVRGRAKHRPPRDSCATGSATATLSAPR